MLGLAALVNAADVVCIAVCIQRGLYPLHQLPVVQILVLQLFGVNVGVLVHVLAVVDDLGESAAGDGDGTRHIIQGRRIICVRQDKFFFGNGAIIIAIDDGRVAFAKVGGTVCLVTGAVGRDILILIFVRDIIVRTNCGTDRSAGAFSMNVCVDNGIAGAAVDIDVTGTAIPGTAIHRYITSANCRAGVTGSIMWIGRRIKTITNATDCIYGAAGDVDGCCGPRRAVTISDCRNIRGTDGGNVSILFNIDREIRKAALPAITNGAALLVGFCMYGGISGDRNSSRVVGAAVIIAISNCSGVSRISLNNGIVRNGDAVSTAETTADRSTIAGSGNNIGIAFNADVFAGTVVAAANGSSAIPSGNGSDLTAGDGNVGCITKIKIFPAISAAANRGGPMVAACQKFAGSVLIGTGLCSTIIVHIVLDGQSAGAVCVRFFDGGVFFLPIVLSQNGIIAVQLKVGVAIALYFNRTGLGIGGINFNVHILQGHIGSLIFCRLHRDGI